MEDNTRKQRENLIEKVFMNILNQKVRVLDRIEEDDIDYAIYYDDESNKSLTDEQLGEYISDFAVVKNPDQDQWIYMIAVHDSGNYHNPPSSDYIESKESYETFDLAFQKLIDAIVLESFGQISEEVYQFSEEGLEG